MGKKALYKGLYYLLVDRDYTQPSAQHVVKMEKKHLKKRLARQAKADS